MPTARYPDQLGNTEVRGTWNFFTIPEVDFHILAGTGTDPELVSLLDLDVTQNAKRVARSNFARFSVPWYPEL